MNLKRIDSLTPQSFPYPHIGSKEGLPAPETASALELENVPFNEENFSQLLLIVSQLISTQNENTEEMLSFYDQT